MRGFLPDAAARSVPYALGATLGYAADRVFGDPRRGHPVAGFGRAAAALEARLWRDTRRAGVLHTALCVGATVAAAAVATAATRTRVSRRGPAGCTGGVGGQAPGIVLTALATWAVLGGASLRREALGIAHALRSHDLEDARRRLPRLCGRDPQALGEADIARAVVESVAENTSDAVVGALVWGALGGVPGLVGFRAVNTLDAMVGHRSARYLRFGWAAARLDDLVGGPGARLTAALATFAGPDPRAARRVWRADGPRHPSPNAGPVEAAFAGALGLRLGGELSYGGRSEHRAVLNPAGRPPEVRDIERAVRLSGRVCLLALLTTTGAALLPTEASPA
ncbi:cobalamin biosynthesis protein [Streptomyces sp. 184]|uniref:cobalamin biosynthesis protein n=1 Tax=Streptomyces sp. 184 TaxID=1827526 RepID=UPI0038915DFD